MNKNILKFSIILLIFAASFSSCWEDEPRKEIEEQPSCDPQSLLKQYPWSAGNPLWVFEMIGEWLENGFYGEIIQCDYRDGRGYSFEPQEANDDFKYCFRNCEGEILYEGMENPIDACPELNIKYRSRFMKNFPSWDNDQDGASDEFLCHVINPFTLPRVKEMLYNCSVYRCDKQVSICSYRDGAGFLLYEHLNAGINCNADFLDCRGNLLCNLKKSGENVPFHCPELNIDFQNAKIILSLNVSLSYPE